MYNAIVPDHLLHALGLFKERLSQSALHAAMREVSDTEARRHYDWLLSRGMTFRLGRDEATELTEAQVLEGLKMYDAAVRMADAFGCAAIGIQYQQGLKDVCVASDLAEGLLNNPDRPASARGGRAACCSMARRCRTSTKWMSVPASTVLTNRVWSALGLDPSDDLARRAVGRRGTERGVDEFVWVFENLRRGAREPFHRTDTAARAGNGSRRCTSRAAAPR
jgi:hypothetical protein